MIDALLGADSLSPIFIDALRDLFQLPFAASAPQAAFDEPFVAEARLTEPAHHLELTLSIVVETASMKRLALHLLEDEELEGAQALVLEIANILAGALKTSFTASGLTFTLGLPAVESFARARLHFDDSPRHARVALATEGSSIEVWLRASGRRHTLLPGRALREGLVVIEDVRDEAGVLLAPAGSRLTQTSVALIAATVPDLTITVSDPDG
jgi:hypothetical protein